MTSHRVKPWLTAVLVLAALVAIFAPAVNRTDTDTIQASSASTQTSSTFQPTTRQTTASKIATTTITVQASTMTEEPTTTTAVPPTTDPADTGSLDQAGIDVPLKVPGANLQPAVRSAVTVQVGPVPYPPPEPAAPDAPPYEQFDSCRGAVDLLFAGRGDYDRAVRIVFRESNNVPTAISPTNALGCAQLTGQLSRPPFLDGPWNDPFWNVLAMRRAVDHPNWGWCHWDIVNYCLPGGEF